MLFELVDANFTAAVLFGKIKKEKV